jgi:hypothetical protein
MEMILAVVVVVVVVVVEIKTRSVILKVTMILIMVVIVSVIVIEIVREMILVVSVSGKVSLHRRLAFCSSKQLPRWLRSKLHLTLLACLAALRSRHTPSNS